MTVVQKKSLIFKWFFTIKKWGQKRYTAWYFKKFWTAYAKLGGWVGKVSRPNRLDLGSGQEVRPISGIENKNSSSWQRYWLYWVLFHRPAVITAAVEKRPRWGCRQQPGTVYTRMKCFCCNASIYEDVPVHEEAIWPIMPVPDKQHTNSIYQFISLASMGGGEQWGVL